jgi:hypothetical protein
MDKPLLFAISSTVQHLKALLAARIGGKNDSMQRKISPPFVNVMLAQDARKVDTGQSKWMDARAPNDYMEHKIATIRDNPQTGGHRDKGSSMGDSIHTVCLRIRYKDQPNEVAKRWGCEAKTGTQG